MDNMMEDDEGPEFVWQDYLDATKTIEVPQINFHHVELTLQNGIEIGMSLEVPVVKENEIDDICWVATIVMACGPLLRLRYYGGDDRSLEFWFNLTKEAAHELGWCKKNNVRLEPPQLIIDKSPDCIDTLNNFLLSATSVPSEMLTGEGLSMVDRIKDGTKVEVNDPQDPYKLWVATIMENVGGRLLLRYDTPGAVVNDFWVFCTSETLHLHGFATKKVNSKYYLQPPSSIIDTHAYAEWKEIIESSPKDDVSSQNLFNYSTIHAHHKFISGMKIEALLPNDRTKICPATISKVFDEVYFLVEIDQVYNVNDNEKKTWLCTVDHPYIFPIEWSKKNNIQIEPPIGWNRLVNGEFDWKNYLKLTKSIAATEELFPQRELATDGGFEVNMRLEAVDPRNEGTICAAHITKIVQDLLWISLDNDPIKCPQHIVHMRSMQIFPVGWCESNLFPLESPKDYATVCRKIDYDDKKIDKRSFVDMPLSDQKVSSWSPKIYFNYRCHTGPMVSKGKLATLPKSVGPGPATLVMKEILSMIVSVGYRSSRILKAIQCDTKAELGYELVELKAKHKDRTYRANVAVVSSGDMVPEFCRNICKKILVCPNLFGPVKVAELSKCPDRCQKGKHRFTLSASKKPTTVYNINNNTNSDSINNQNDDNIDDDDDSEKSKPWGKKKRKNKKGKWIKGNNNSKNNNNNHNNNNKNKEEEDDDDEDDEDDNNDDSAYINMDKNQTDDINNDEQQQSSETDMLLHKNLTKTKKLLIQKTSVPSSNASDDSRSSFNDRRSKESNIDSPGSINTPKNSLNGSLSQSIKREHDFDDAGESEADDNEDEYVRIQQKQRRPKARKLESNPLSWSVDDVFRYLRKTSDCKDLAYRVRQEEIDGLAFLLLNLPSLTEHMKLRTSLAMKLCRHVEQVKVTYFIRYVNEKEPTPALTI